MLKEDGGKRYRITVKGKDNSQSTEQIKSQLKKDMNPTDIKAGIKTLKTLRDGGILIKHTVKKRYTLSAERLTPSMANSWKL